MKVLFPTAINPPKLVKPYGPLLGYIATVALVSMAVIHLFRLDTLVPIIDKVLPNGSGTAGTFVMVVVLSEIFAIPFMFRLKLSPLAHLSSGFLAILAPLMWTLLTIWTYGLGNSTGQFGESMPSPSTWWLIVLNLVWLTFNFVALWALGYNNLNIREFLKRTPAKKPAKS